MYYSCSQERWYVEHTDGLTRPYWTFAAALQAYLFNRDYSARLTKIWEG